MNTINLKVELYNRYGSVQIAKIPTKEMVADEKGELHEETKMVETNVTLGALLIHACLKESGDRTEETILKKFNLFNEMEGQDEIEVSDEELETLKTLAAETYDVFNAGTIITILNTK